MSESTTNILSTRETEILLLIADQLTMAKIAQKLFISIGTVETHRRNIIKKLEVKNTAGLIIKGLYLNIIRIDKGGSVVQT